MEIGAKTLSTEENHQTTSNGQIGGKTCSYPRNPYLKYLPFYTLVECFVRVCYFNFLFFFFFIVVLKLVIVMKMFSPFFFRLSSKGQIFTFKTELYKIQLKI